MSLILGLNLEVLWNWAQVFLCPQTDWLAAFLGLCMSIYFNFLTLFFNSSWVIKLTFSCCVNTGEISSEGDRGVERGPCGSWGRYLLQRNEQFFQTHIWTPCHFQVSFNWLWNTSSIFHVGFQKLPVWQT